MKKIYLFGTGASAKYFLEQYHAQYLIKAVVDDTYEGDFYQHKVIKTSEMKVDDVDYVIVASWAINDISSRLQKHGVELNKIQWFQHNKNCIVPADCYAATSGHPEISPEKVLYAFYDLNVARATYDILAFLCLADIQKEKVGAEYVHVVIVPAENNEFNVAARGIIDTTEHHWRKRQILLQCCGTLPSCLGVSMTSTKMEADSLLSKAKHIFPVGYEVDHPVACWEFNHLFDALSETSSIARLRATEKARALVSDFLSQHPVAGKRIISVTLRDSEIKPKRNSKNQSWRQFMSDLDKSAYFIVIVPDTERSWSQNWKVEGTVMFPEACFNVELRMALYELCDINLGVNNGPMHLCALNELAKYIMYKQITEDYAHTSTQSFIDRGFVIGQDFPGAKDFQYLVWEDDDYDVIRASFEKFEQQESAKNETSEH